MAGEFDSDVLMAVEVTALLTGSSQIPHRSLREKLEANRRGY
jgi:hypothetical protein